MLKLSVMFLLLAGCRSVFAPSAYVYKEIPTQDFTMATWQKISEPTGVYKVYIEGDGYAFDARGRATPNPTPRGTLVRELAFGDNSPNVVYLARPCQYVQSEFCSKRYWTTARFAPEIINASSSAIKQVVGDNSVILIGFSGGAQVAGLAAAKSELKVRKIVTIAGNLDPVAWTQYHHLPLLTESMTLEDYRRRFAEIPQVHYAGSEDKVMPPELVRKFVGNEALVVTVDGANHNSGWEEVYPKIWKER